MLLNDLLFDSLPFTGKNSTSSSDDSAKSFLLAFLDFLGLKSSSSESSYNFRLSKFTYNSSKSYFLIFNEFGKAGMLVTYSAIASYNLTFIDSLWILI